MCNGIECRIEGGVLIARKSSNPNYPGIDVEFIADNENKNIKSRPRVLVEKPVGEELRVLVWNDKKSEDYSEEIEFR